MDNIETDKALRARQKLIESESSAIGVKRYREALSTRGEDEMPAGTRLISTAIAPLSAAIEEHVDAALSGKAKRGKEVVKYLSQFNYDEVAFMTAKTCIESLSDNKTAQAVASILARRLNEMLDYSNLKEQDPQAWRRYTNRIKNHPTMSIDHLHVIVKKQMEWAGISVIKWDSRDKVKLGVLLIDLMCETTGLVAIKHFNAGKNRATCKLLVSTEATRKWLEQSHRRSELLQPFDMPMVCIPKDWSSAYGGGYLSETSNYPLIKTANKTYLDELSDHEMPIVYGAVNTLQRTGWQVNKAIFTAMTKAWKLGGKIGKLPSTEDEPLPPKMYDSKDEEAHKRWKRRAAAVHTANHKTCSSRIQLASKLWVAEKYQDEKQFFYPYALDWRGRAYPVSAGLNPQGDDSAKALLKFAEGKPLGVNGAYWLAIQGANCYGVDNVPFSERIAFIEENYDAIIHSAMFPLETEWWQKADKPWCFLAFCLEWNAMLMCPKREEFISYLPIAFDGTCNGLQNFSAMLRDEIGGQAVGLLPTDTPPDVYTDVLNEAERLIAEEDSFMATKWAGSLVRELCKRNTMTMPYGVTIYGMKEQIMESFDKMRANGHKFGFEVGLQDATYLANVNYRAIGNIVVAARQAMDWLKGVAAIASKDGLPISWVTPSGLPVLQSYSRRFEKRYDFDISGKRFQMMMRLESGKLDKHKQAAGIAPNFVHSLDASHLMLTVNYCAEAGVTSFAMIHDSYGTHAADADTLSLQLRRAFHDQYSADVLGDLRESILAKLDDSAKKEVAPLPDRGKLELDRVLDSEYFFA